MASSGSGVDGESVDGESVDGESVDGESVDGESVDGESVDGESVDGESVDGESVDGESVDGESVDGESVDGESVDGESVDGESVDGESVNGESVNGESVNGESVDGESVDGESVNGRLAEALGSPVTAAELCRVVGSRVRELRQALNMTMSAFAAEADISLGMLSKIEHGQSAPSLSTLVRLAATARVPVTALFRGLDEEHDLVIVRAGQGHEIHHQGGGPGRLYQDLGTLRGPNRVIEPMITTITEPGGVFPLYQHPGVEFLHVLEGTIDYGYGGTTYRLSAGDTMQIHGEVAHGPVELIELPIRFISIKVYPANEPRTAAGG